MIKRTSIVCLEVAIGVAIVAALLLAASAWRLSQGPVSLKFLLPYAADLMDAPDNAVRTDLDDLILSWEGWERALDVRALGVRIAHHDGKPLAQIGEVSLALSFRALMDGTVAPTSLELIRPRVRLTRGQDGGIDMDVGGGADGSGVQDETGPAADESLLLLLLNELSGAPRPDSQLRYLNRVGVIGAVLRVDDRTSGATWGSRRADFSIRRAPSGLAAEFDLDFDFGDTLPVAQGELVYDKTAGLVDADVTFDTIDVGVLADKFPQLSGLRPLRTSVGGNVALQIGLDGEVKTGRFLIKTGAGALTLPGDEPPTEFRGIEFRGRINRDPDQLQIASTTIQLEQAVLSGTGVVTRVGDLAALNATIDIGEMPFDALMALWPRTAAASARAWTAANLQNGAFRGGTASLTARVGLSGEDRGAFTVDSINGRFALSGFTVDYLAPLPPIEDASATATFSNDRFDFAVHGGHLGRLRIEEGAVNIWDLGRPKEFISVSTLIRGPVSEALALIDHPRLGLLSRMDIEKTGAAGEHATRLKIRFPLLNDVKAEEVAVSASSNLTGLTLRKVLGEHPIEDGTISLSVDNTRFSATGRGTLLGQPMQFVWKEDLSGRERIRTRLAGDMVIGDRLVKSLAPEFLPYRQGDTPARFTYQQNRAGRADLSLEMDLTPARIFLPGVNWAKQPGRPGKAELSVILEDDKVSQVPFFDIEAGVFQATGRQTMELSGAETVTLDRFVLGPTSLSADIRRGADGVYDVRIEGEGFDAVAFVTGAVDDTDTGAFPPFRVNANFEKFWIGRGAPISDMQVILNRQESGWRRIYLKGALPKSGREISLKMEPRPGGHELAIYSTDAGTFLAELGVSKAIRGGTLELSATRPAGEPSGAWTGLAEIKRFEAVDAPNLARVLTLASLTGIGDVLSGKGIAFDRLELPFVFQNDVATIKEGRAVGSELGLTASGTLDTNADTIKLNGTIVPAYTINSLPSKIPLVGAIFRGEKGGGLFAASYSVNGDVDSPKIAVNPLSILTPGIIGRLLRGAVPASGETPVQDEPANPPSQGD